MSELSFCLCIISLEHINYSFYVLNCNTCYVVVQLVEALYCKS
jgi:hypothetical protein